MFLYIRSMKRALHIVFKALVKFVLLVAVFAVFPIYCARAFDLDVFPFLITWDFIMLGIFAAGSDYRRGINPTPSSKQSRIRFPFPFYPDEF